MITTYARQRNTRRALLLASAMLLAGSMLANQAAGGSGEPAPRGESWLMRSPAQIIVPAMQIDVRQELADLKALAAKRQPADLQRFRWWSAGGPVHRWNEIMLDEMQEAFVVLPLAARHLALFHAALDDAVAIARHNRSPARKGEADAVDSALERAAARVPAPASPSEHAAVAAAAAEILTHLFPARAALHAARAEEAMRIRLVAGADYPKEIEAGRLIGRKVAALAIARGNGDGSDAKWSGSVPEGPGKWKGANPIAPLAGTWQPWLLARPDELRPPAPPAADSEATRTALAELKSFPRTPRTNHRATFWEVHGGARAHILWNDLARTKLMESRASAPVAARLLAALNVAMADAGIACWDAKFAYWHIRPSQLDGELKPVFAPPNHPSFPAAHGCFSTAAATVLAEFFPLEAQRFTALGKEAAEARVWAGIHYRYDIEAGQALGRKVAERALARAFAR